MINNRKISVQINGIISKLLSEITFRSRHINLKVTREIGNPVIKYDIENWNE
jgi:hypothetical protein